MNTPTIEKESIIEEVVDNALFGIIYGFVSVAFLFILGTILTTFLASIAGGLAGIFNPILGGLAVVGIATAGMTVLGQIVLNSIIYHLGIFAIGGTFFEEVFKGLGALKNIGATVFFAFVITVVPMGIQYYNKQPFADTGWIMLGFIVALINAFIALKIVKIFGMEIEEKMKN